MSHLDRALVLLEQSRPDLAEKELRQAIAGSPDHPMPHALLAICLSNRKQYKEATEEAESAVHLAPDFAYAHYALARVLFDRDRYDEAAEAIHEAIRLDPHDANQFGLLSQIHHCKSRWSEALAAAERGLELDPEHELCTNMRAISLVQLGRKAEAGATIEGALARNPESAFSHANQGWALLHQNDPAKALEHFREALRLDPEFEWARQGIVEALKARYIVYRPILQFFLWMSRLTPAAQWGVIIGAVVGRRILQNIARQFPALAPFITPILVLYMIFVLMTWIADPLFNLVLRLNRFGRLALSREQIVASNWIGACIAAGLIALGTWVFTGHPLALFFAIGFGAWVIPLSATFNCSPGWPRLVMGGATAALAILGLGMVGLILSPMIAGNPRLLEAARMMGVAFLIGSILSPWLGNALIMARPKK